MVISFNYLEELQKSNLIKIVKVPENYYYYKYVTEFYIEGAVFGLVEIEHSIVDDISGKIIGYFGVNFQHNIMAYYLKI